MDGDISDRREDDVEYSKDGDVDCLTRGGEVKPFGDGLDVVASEKSWVDDVWFDRSDEAIAEWEIGEEGSEDRDRDTDDEDDQPELSARLSTG